MSSILGAHRIGSTKRQHFGTHVVYNTLWSDEFFFLFVAEETSPYLSKILIDHALRKAIYFAETRNEVKKRHPFFGFFEFAKIPLNTPKPLCERQTIKRYETRK